MLHLYQDKPIGGADILNSLADVNINNPENKQIIYYDQATGTWRNYDPPFVNSENVLHTVEECAASTNPEDVAGASVASSLNSAFPKRSGVTAHNIANGATSAFTPYTVPQTCLGYFQIQSNGSAAASIRVNGMAFLRNLLASPISVMFTLMQGDVIDIAGTAANAYIDLYY